jgi:diguanylate cyclase
MKTPDPESLCCVLDELNNGLFILDRNHTVVYWNRYMSHNSQKSGAETIGKNLFEVFQNLPEAWLKKKINSAFILNTTLFTSWEQRPWIFPFPNTRLIDSHMDFMYQNCVFSPVRSSRDGTVEFLSISLYDATELALKHFQVQKTLKELTESSITDGLTRIYNRRYIQDALELEVSKFRRHRHPACLMLLDVDFFKKINDEHGHLCGDEILKNIASTTRDLMRKGDVVGRYGGEEFAVILPMTDLAGGYLAAERLRTRIEQTVTVFRNLSVKVTVSIGLANLTDDHSSAEEWLQEADNLLYESKENGRNRTTGSHNRRDG